MTEEAAIYKTSKYIDKHLDEALAGAKKLIEDLGKPASIESMLHKQYEAQIRDHMAISAMNGMLCNTTLVRDIPPAAIQRLARASYEIADAMMSARKDK